jgi:hypothetical protein
MFQSKNPKTKYVNTDEGYYDWRDAGNKVERLGQQLDAIRSAVQRTKDKPESWAHKHWREREAVMLRKWQLTSTLQRCGLRQNWIDDKTRNIDYGFWEKSEEVIGFPLFDWLNSIGNDWMDANRIQTGLTRSWENARNEKLQKARQGLA